MTKDWEVAVSGRATREETVAELMYVIQHLSEIIESLTDRVTKLEDEIEEARQ